MLTIFKRKIHRGVDERMTRYYTSWMTEDDWKAVTNAYRHALFMEALAEIERLQSSTLSRRPGAQMTEDDYWNAATDADKP